MDANGKPGLLKESGRMISNGASYKGMDDRERVGGND
jgi:hypothetical protein